MGVDVEPDVLSIKGGQFQLVLGVSGVNGALYHVVFEYTGQDRCVTAKN